MGRIRVPTYKYETVIKQKYGMKPLRNRFTSEKDALMYLNSYLNKGFRGIVRRL